MSPLRRLTPHDRPVLDAFLDRRRISSMFLRANLFHSGLEDAPEPFHGLYMGAFTGDLLTDVAAHCWNGNIVLQAPTRPCRSPPRKGRRSDEIGPMEAQI